MHTTK